MTFYEEDTAKYIGKEVKQMTESDLNKESGMNEEEYILENKMNKLQTNIVPKDYDDQIEMFANDIRDLGEKLLFLSCKKYKYVTNEIKSKERDVKNLLKEKLLVWNLIKQAKEINEYVIG